MGISKFSSRAGARSEDPYRSSPEALRRARAARYGHNNSRLGYRRSSPSTGFIKVAAAAVILIVAIVIGVAFFGPALATTGHASCMVTDKDRSSDRDGSSVYRVYTNCGVFNVQDDLWRLKFNSADTYAKLEKNHLYEFNYVGVRNGFLSLFPNIISAEEVREGSPE